MRGIAFFREGTIFVNPKALQKFAILLSTTRFLEDKMKRSQMLVMFFVIALFGSAMVFAQTAGSFFNLPIIRSVFSAKENVAEKKPVSAKQESPKQVLPVAEKLPTEKPNSEIPAHILYAQIFRLVVSLKKNAESLEANSARAVGLMNYFKNRARLDEEENQTLAKIALEYAQEAAPLDAQAVAVIAQARATYSTGVVPQDQPPPTELVNLQEQKNELVRHYRDRLQESLGTAGFAKLDEFVKNDFASRFQVIPLSAVNLDQEEERGAKQ